MASIIKGEKLLNYDLILASSSPRRAEILSQLGVNFKVLPAEIDETPFANESAVDYVQRMALEKAMKVIDTASDNCPVLGADTSVVLGSKIFGKPKNFNDALTMLDALSGNTHQVLSSVVLGNKEECKQLLSSTEVRFRTISPQECHTYWQTGEPKDKAGSYAIQGYGAIFVESIRGSYSGVVGLPIAETEQLLRQFNVPIWQL